MSFAEIDYRHGVDLITMEADKKPIVEFQEYTPQHKLRILPENDEELTVNKLKKLVETELPDRVDGKLSDDFLYLVLKVKLDKVSNDEIGELENLVSKKNAVLCKIQKVIPSLDVTTLSGNEKIHSIDDILNLDPLDTLKETFRVKNQSEMNERQEHMLRELIESAKETEDQ